MLNFTVGPVSIEEEVLEIGAAQVPYFRTTNFSEMMLENERLMLQFADAPEDSRTVFLTGSGTASMEAAIMNVLTPEDKALVVSGGGFGNRFASLCEIHGIPYDKIQLDLFQPLTAECLQVYENVDYTAFVINLHETSTCVLYDIDLVSDFCKRKGLFLIVDSISSFIADPFSMKDCNADVVLTGSQKALALPPGLSILMLGPRALERIEQNNVRSLYFNLKAALKDGLRGQTPFTPAVSILIQLNKRLNMLNKRGLLSETERIHLLARDFRDKIQSLPFDFPSSAMSNAATALSTKADLGAHGIFELLKDEYEIFVCPNGGELKDRVFRVGHIGALSTDDNTALIESFKDIQRRGLI